MAPFPYGWQSYQRQQKTVKHSFTSAVSFELTAELVFP
jgi:hypothetical protein